MPSIYLYYTTIYQSQPYNQYHYIHPIIIPKLIHTIRYLVIKLCQPIHLKITISQPLYLDYQTNPIIK